jgi:hypothetical protein
LLHLLRLLRVLCALVVFWLLISVVVILLLLLPTMMVVVTPSVWRNPFHLLLLCFPFSASPTSTAAARAGRCDCCCQI